MYRSNVKTVHSYRKKQCLGLISKIRSGVLERGSVIGKNRMAYNVGMRVHNNNVVLLCALFLKVETWLDCFNTRKILFAFIWNGIR